VTFARFASDPPRRQIAEFNEALERYGRAKLKLRARIIEAGQTAVDVQAAFVVTRSRSPAGTFRRRPARGAQMCLESASSFLT
jgi:hypothetical protein